MWIWFLFNACQTPTEIEELSLRAPRPVVTTEWPTPCWSKASGGCHGFWKLCESEASATTITPRRNWFSV